MKWFGLNDSISAAIEWAAATWATTVSKPERFGDRGLRAGSPGGDGRD